MRNIRTLIALSLGALMAAGCSSAMGEGSEEVGTQDEALASCITLTMGGPTSCKPTSLWKQYADQDCRARGLRLASYTVNTPCGGGNHRFVTYKCCP